MSLVEYPLSNEDAVNQALRLAREKNKLGLLIKPSEDGLNSTDKGDEETIYSIASDICQWANNEDEARTAIENKLEEIYPDLV